MVKVEVDEERSERGARTVRDLDTFMSKKLTEILEEAVRQLYNEMIIPEMALRSNATCQEFRVTSGDLKPIAVTAIIIPMSTDGVRQIIYDFETDSAKVVRKE